MEITKGHDFSDNLIDAARLNALVSDAVFSGIEPGQLLSTLSFISYARPASPVEGNVAVKADGKLEAYTGAAWQDIDSVPMIVTLTNKSGKTLNAGEAATVDTGTNFALGSVGSGLDSDTFWDARRRCIGVIAENIADDAAGQVYVRGPCYAAFRDGTHAAGTWIANVVQVTGDGDERFTAINGDLAESPGILLESISGAATVTGLVYLWR